MLYKELYYRHIYSKLQPTLEQRIESWLNYCDIFNLLLTVDTPLSLELPNQWLWDMIDEFIYQFQVCAVDILIPISLACLPFPVLVLQAFCQFRSRVKGKTEDELNMLKEASQVASRVLLVLPLLKSMPPPFLPATQLTPNDKSNGNHN